MAKEKICGIYKIENIITKKMYIGLSVNIYSRWQNHRNMLNRNDHSNIFLQRAWNKYGKESFKFNILEKCREEQLSEKEQYYIKLYKTNNDKYGYNLSTGGDRPKINKNVLERISNERSRKVLQFTKDGRFIKEYKNAKIAAKNYNVNESLIYQCCNKRINSACGYLWEYKDNYNKLYLNNKVDNIDGYKRIFKNNPICQLSLKGEFIKEWKNCREAGEFYNVVYENIRSCCDKKYGRKTYIGYIWIYAEEYYKNGINLNNYKHDWKTKPISQYDLEGNFIVTYESAREAEKETGIGFRMISRVCNGDRSHTHGFIFKFN